MEGKAKDWKVRGNSYWGKNLGQKGKLLVEKEGQLEK